MHAKVCVSGYFKQSKILLLQTRTQSLFKKIGDWVEAHAGSHGKGRRKNSDAPPTKAREKRPGDEVGFF